MASKTRVVSKARKEILALVKAFMENAGNPQPLHEEDDYNDLEDCLDEILEKLTSKEK